MTTLGRLTQFGTRSLRRELLTLNTNRIEEQWVTYHSRITIPLSLSVKEGSAPGRVDAKRVGRVIGIAARVGVTSSRLLPNDQIDVAIEHL